MVARWGKVAGCLVGAAVVVLAVAGGVYWYVDRSDPVIEGKRMSAWALDLVWESYGRDEYRVKPQYMRVFKTDRVAAIRALMNAVNCQRSRGRGLWFRVTGLLPKPIASALRPKPIYTRNRWAAVLAMSNLAREKPDARIPAFFLECMKDRSANYHDKVVRKIAAYEAGPWLDPEHPEVIVEILRLALADNVPEVRRDACRRIAASAGDAGTNYGEAVRKLLPQVRQSEAELTPEAARAVEVLISSNGIVALRDRSRY